MMLKPFLQSSMTPAHRGSVDGSLRTGHQERRSRKPFPRPSRGKGTSLIPDRCRYLHTNRLVPSFTLGPRHPFLVLRSRAKLSPDDPPAPYRLEPEIAE